MALRVLSALLLAIVVAACGGEEPAAPAESELDPIAVTRWTGRSELFAEYPPLVVGRTSRFAIHLTDIGTFKAVTSGRVEVRLEGGGEAPESFRVDAPSRPGIFGVDVKPARAGARELVIVLKSAALTDMHRVSNVTVYADQQAARKAVESAPEEADGISFLKEQQWALDFATAVAEERAIRESIRVPATIVARPGGAAQVVAPIDGRLLQVTTLALGSAVARGQELARLLPPPSTPGDLPQLEQARAEAGVAVQLAVRDRERA
jgi:cobalt-zinc-cadmium efflux system membrane fusion protein